MQAGCDWCDHPLSVHNTRMACGLCQVIEQTVGIPHDPPPIGAYLGGPDGPHSRACGLGLHSHGEMCARDCPTCHGHR